MSGIQLLVLLVVVGLAVWAINNYIPAEGSVRKILNVVVVCVVILYILNAFGIVRFTSGLRLPGR